jgi:hypothetical protein
MNQSELTFVNELVEELTDAAVDFGSALAFDYIDLKVYESNLNNASEKLLNAIKRLSKVK